MSWFQASITANCIITIICIILVVDRTYSRRLCNARHEPIDKALEEIKITLGKIWDAVDALRHSVWKREGKNGIPIKGEHDEGT